jgi:S1-C subfamily serine protease
VLFRTDGHILTNSHVVQAASSIKVVLANGRELRAKLIGADPETDVAVIKIDPDPDDSIPIAALGSAKDLKVGQQAVAIGSPLGLAGGPSVTVGVISAVGRQLETRDGGPALLDMIQTDAPIAPGSSGGALVDADGEVIGITTAIALSDTGAQALGFATPIDIARDAGGGGSAPGKVVHVWMGVEGEDVDADTADRLRIVGGATVRKVRADSPATTAGLAVQDVITHVDGREISSMGGLIVALRSHRPGDKVMVGYWRNGDFHSAGVVLAARPKNL